MKMLILGGSGFVGSFLSNNLPTFPNEVRLKPGRLELLRQGDGDLSLGVERAIGELRPDVVINLIAQTDLGLCSESPDESSLLNVSLPVRVAKVLPPTSLLIHVSSDAVFGGARAPYGLRSPASPTNEYGRQKWQADQGIIENRSNFLILRGSFFGLSNGGRTGTLSFFASALSELRTVPGFVDYFNNPISLIELTEVVQTCLNDSIRGTLHLGAQRSLSKFSFGVLVAENLGVPKSLVTPTLSPLGFHSHGGLDLTLESRSSWEILGMVQPSVEEGVVKSLRGSKYIANF